MISNIYNIDCIKYMKTIPDNFFDLAIVDPPYGINAPNMSMGTNEKRKKNGYPGISTAKKQRLQRLGSGGGKLKNRILNTSVINWDYEKPNKKYFKELFRVSKNQIIWGGNYFDLPPTRCVVCWDKIQPWDNFSQFELAWTSFDYPAAMFRFSNRGGKNEIKKIHPTEKPIQLYKFLLRKFAKQNFKILDTHLGSGNSRIAAYDANIDFYGCEIDNKYFTDSELNFQTHIKKLKINFNDTKNDTKTENTLLLF